MFTLPIVEDYLKAEQAYTKARAALLTVMREEAQRQRARGRSTEHTRNYFQSLSIPDDVIFLLLEKE